MANEFTQAQLKALMEVIKDLTRWLVSFLIGAILDQGFAFFTNSQLDPRIVAIIGFIFKYLDYAWHKYNKEINPIDGESQGLLRI